MKLVIDTNIIISALVKNGFARDFILSKGINFEFVTPAYALSEISKYKKDICKKANINSQEFYELLGKLMRYIQIINLEFYSSFIKETKSLIADINDVPFLALALAFNCLIWSDDKHFLKQNKVKILTTKDMIKILR